MTNDTDVPRSADSVDSAGAAGHAGAAGSAGAARTAKGMSEGAQVVAALVLVGGLAGGFWALAKYGPESADQADLTPAACVRTRDDVPPSKPLSGSELCEALNRPDLPTLLGTPDDRVHSAYSNEGSYSESLGITTQDPGAVIGLDAYSVKLEASDDDLTIAEIAEYLPKAAQRRTVLGHPAYLYPGRSIGIVFDEGKSSTVPGGVSRTLLVAKDPKDGGGSYEIAIWREDDVAPDEAALLRVAERVLPTVPGWTAG